MNATPTLTELEVRIPAGEAWLCGDLSIPQGAEALVLFAHGSGSGRHSARNRQVARHLQRAGTATLLFDLLTAQEGRDDQGTRQHRFDIALLTQRLIAATDWAQSQAWSDGMALGYFGASTGSAAALIAAAKLGERVGAVVSRGGRPDLAGPAVLRAVTAPTLLIVGGADPSVAHLNRAATTHLKCDWQLLVVPGATHLFEEAGALEQVSLAAAHWFAQSLAHAAEPH